MAEQPVGALRTELPRFIAAGVLGLLVDIGMLYGARALGLGWFGGRALSFPCAVWATWQLNRRYTFARRTGLSAWREWWRYFFAMLGGGAVNYAAYSAVVLALPQLTFLPAIAVAVGSLAGMTFNFASARYYVFHRPS
jgi:putative flippase GtrA